VRESPNNKKIVVVEVDVVVSTDGDASMMDGWMNGWMDGE
jgi:hypothetical protein